MKTAGKILLGATGLALVGIYKYRIGVDDLQFSVGRVTFSGTNVGLEIICFNPAKFFTYPVPSMFLNIFDANSNYLGSVKAANVQYIRPGVNFLNTVVMPDYTTLINLMAGMFGGNMQNNFIINGALFVGGQQIGIDTEIQTPAALNQ